MAKYTEAQLEKKTKKELISIIQALTTKAPNTNINMTKTGIIKDSKEFYPRPIISIPMIKEEPQTDTRKGFNEVSNKDTQPPQETQVTRGEKWQ